MNNFCWFWVILIGSGWFSLMLVDVSVSKSGFKAISRCTTCLWNKLLKEINRLDNKYIIKHFVKKYFFEKMEETDHVIYLITYLRTYLLTLLFELSWFAFIILFIHNYFIPIRNRKSYKELLAVKYSHKKLHHGSNSNLKVELNPLVPGVH